MLDRYILWDTCGLWRPFLFVLETAQKVQLKTVLNRYISENPKGRANKSKEREKRRVGRAPSQKEGSLAAMTV